MSISWPWVALVILICALGSFFFALAESALFALGKWRAQQLGETHPTNGQRVLTLLSSPDDLLAALIFGNTLCNAVMVTGMVWLTIHEGVALLAPMLGLSIFILFACEVAPKTLAVRAPEFWALRIARPVELLVRTTNPFLAFAKNSIDWVVERVIPKSVKPNPNLSDEEYSELLEMAFQQGALEQSEKQAILKIISLDRQTAEDVMKPRATLSCISDDLTQVEMVAAARRLRHTRIPIYDETPDTIVGILNTRALLTNPEIDLAEAIELPSFVPASMNLLQLMQSLQQQRRGVAIVLDEFGGTAGLITMEDILEGIVGRTRRTAEDRGFIFEKLAKDQWRVSGQMRTEDFRREFPDLGLMEDVDTMGGLLVARFETIPTVGQFVVWGGLKLTAQIVDERRVHELRVEVVRQG